MKIKWNNLQRNGVSNKDLCSWYSRFTEESASLFQQIERALKSSPLSLYCWLHSPWLLPILSLVESASAIGLLQNLGGICFCYWSPVNLSLNIFSNVLMQQFQLLSESAMAHRASIKPRSFFAYINF